MIYEMTTGAMPFAGATTSHTIVQILEKDPVPLTNLVSAPPELERIVAKAMAKNPDERYQTAKDMLIDLRSLKKRLDVEAEIHRTSSPSTPVPIVSPEPAKRRVLVMALIAMAIVTAAVLAFNFWRSSLRSTKSNVPTSVAPPVERTLTYWVTVQKFKGGKAYQDPFTLAGEINFEANYRIRVHVRSPGQGYLYVLNEGPTTSGRPEFVVLFPSETSNNGASFLAAGQVADIPEESWIYFDEQQGVEKLWLVFSEAAVPELEAVKQFANRKTKGLITDVTLNKTVQSFFNNPSLPKSGAEKGETLTTVKATGKLLVYAVRLEHH